MRTGKKFPFEIRFHVQFLESKACLSGKASVARCQDAILQIREKSWPWPRGLPAAA